MLKRFLNYLELTHTINAVELSRKIAAVYQCSSFRSEGRGRASEQFRQNR